MKILFHTLGCKANQSDTETLIGLFSAQGVERAAREESPDAVIVNTCTVTAVSDQKSRQSIRKLGRMYPGAALIVCGCMPRAGTLTAEDAGADWLWCDALDEKFVQWVLDKHGTSGLSAVADGHNAPTWGHTRHFLRIQDGCNNHCTYCIIPKARGTSRSIPLEQLQLQAKRRHAKEIVLTGIEISAYGLDIPPLGLADAIRAVHKAVPEARIRLGSLEPRTITKEFLAEIKDLPICPHYHLSLQSGCDRILKRMGRRYDTARYRESVALLRQQDPHAAVTTDLIVGFPGETEEDFAETLAYMEELAFAEMHIFPYSRREGTPAAEMPEQISRKIKQERSRQALTLAERMRDAYRHTQKGRELQVLFETEAADCSYGTSENYLEVTLPQTELKGKIVPVVYEG